MRLKKKEQSSFQLFIFFVSLFLISFLIVSNFKMEGKRKELKKRIEDLNSKVQVLQRKNQELKKIINQAKSETYWEEKAREEGYVKKGEEAIVIKKIKEKEKTEEQSETIWKRIIDLFPK